MITVYGDHHRTVESLTRVLEPFVQYGVDFVVLLVATPFGVDSHCLGFGACRVVEGATGPHIEVSLPLLVREGRRFSAIRPIAYWYALLFYVLVGIGYLMTADDRHHVTRDAYVRDPRSRQYVDNLAIQFALMHLRTLSNHDQSFEMPMRLRGYLGRRITREKRLLDAIARPSVATTATSDCQFRAIVRSRDLIAALGHGVHLSPGHVLDHLGLPKSSSGYAYLRRIATVNDIGHLVRIRKTVYRYYVLADLERFHQATAAAPFRPRGRRLHRSSHRPAAQRVVS